MQGAGAGILLVPIQAIAFPALPPQYRTEAAAVFNLVNDVNPMIDAKSITETDRAAILSAIDRVDGVLGVLSLSDDEAVPQEIHDLVEQRTEARRARNFGLADEMRDRIVAAGYVIEDSPDGTKVRKK